MTQIEAVIGRHPGAATEYVMKHVLPSLADVLILTAAYSQQPVPMDMQLSTVACAQPQAAARMVAGGGDP